MATPRIAARVRSSIQSTGITRTPIRPLIATCTCCNCRPLQQHHNHTNTRFSRSSSTSSSQTYYNLFPTSLPSGPPPAGSYKLNTRALRSEFLRLQQTHHPDLHSSSPQENISAYINSAYRTLLDPLARAEYILSLHGLEAGGEEEKLSDADILQKEFLLEVMGIREDVDEASTAAEVTALKKENAERMLRCEDELEVLFAESKWTQAKDVVVRMRYWAMVRRSLDEKDV